MRLIAIIAVLAGLFGAYRWWTNGHELSSMPESGAQSFIPVEMPEGSARNTVLVLAPANCPSEQAQRARALVAALKAQGIPVAESSSMDFDLDNPSPDQIAGAERAVAVFKLGAPAVFVNGMAMSNPTAAQTVAEYRRTRL